MGVFLPTCAFGNDYMLACIGGNGEVMSFFAPRVDFAQHVREGLPAVWLPDEPGGRFAYTFDGAFRSDQWLRPGSNILETKLISDDLNLRLEFTDLAHAAQPVLVRQVRLSLPRHSLSRRSDAGRGRRVRFASYFRLALGECDEKNAVHHLPKHRVMRQMWRDHYMIVGCSEPYYHQCGKWRDGRSQVKHDLQHGWLSGQEQDIGQVDFAIGADGSLAGAELWELKLVMAYGEEEEQAIERCLTALQEPFDAQVEAVEKRCRAYTTPLVQGFADPGWQAQLSRALLTVRDLADEGTGAVAAAPEFDPTYELSGGYGYCWPRDAAEVCMALAALGDREIPRRALEWCRQTQMASGHWYQRYWSDGQHAPSWCVYPDFYQLDQTCCTLWAICELADHLEGADRATYLSGMQECADRALEALLGALEADGLHETAADAWEVHRGSFTYTNAALYAALRGCHRVFGADCSAEAERVKAAVIDKLWLRGERRFARGLTMTRELDLAFDSSTLGVFDPYGLLDLAVDEERSMAADHLAAIEARLSVDARGGRAILRFENESYMGGGPAAVNTLWAARSHLKLALCATESAEVEERLQRALAYIRTALANTNPTGQLPELIPWNGYDYWAAPHGWATAVLIDCIRLLQEFPDHAGSAPPTR